MSCVRFLPFYPTAEPGPKLKPPPVALPRATTHEGHESPSCVQGLFPRNNSDQATYPDNMNIDKPPFIIYNDDFSTCPSLHKGNLFPRQQKKTNKQKTKKIRKTERQKKEAALIPVLHLLLLLFPVLSSL